MREDGQRGVRAATDIPCNMFVAEYESNLLTPDEARDRETRHSEEGEDMYMLEATYEGKKVIFDATYRYNSCGRFINHSKKRANLLLRNPIQVRGRLRIGFIAKRAIKAGEELFFNYNLESYSKIGLPEWFSRESGASVGRDGGVDVGGGSGVDVGGDKDGGVNVDGDGSMNVGGDGGVNVGGDGSMNVGGDGGVNVGGDGSMNVGGDGGVNVSGGGGVDVGGDGSMNVGGDGGVNVSGDGSINVGGDGGVNVSGGGGVDVGGDGSMNFDEDGSMNVGGGGGVDVGGDGGVDVAGNGDVGIPGGKGMFKVCMVPGCGVSVKRMWNHIYGSSHRAMSGQF